MYILLGELEFINEMFFNESFNLFIESVLGVLIRYI